LGLSCWSRGDTALAVDHLTKAMNDWRDADNRFQKMDAIRTILSQTKKPNSIPQERKEDSS